MGVAVWVSDAQGVTLQCRGALVVPDNFRDFSEPISRPLGTSLRVVVAGTTLQGLRPLALPVGALPPPSSCPPIHQSVGAYPPITLEKRCLLSLA